MHVRGSFRALALVAGIAAAGPALAYNVTVSSKVTTYGAAGSVVDLAATANNQATNPRIDCAVGATTGCTGIATDNDLPVVLQANPGANSAVAGWNGCPNKQTTFGGVSGDYCVLPSGNTNRTVWAYFKPTAYTLSVKAGAGGSVSAGALGTCAGGSTCTYVVPAGASVALSASPDSGKLFYGWSGCSSTTGSSCTVIVASAKAVSASFFTGSTFRVTVGVKGAGTVTGTGISCPGTCATTLSPGSSLTLTASATGFQKWYGCTTSSGTTCDLTSIQTNTAIYAVFDPGTTNCSGCHGVPPPAPHVANTNCGLCHPGYTASSVNTGLHQNGKVDIDHMGSVSPVSVTWNSTTPALSGSQVTARCIGCHPTQADDVLASVHFRWQANSTMTGQTQLGKRNLINDFCVAIPSNEPRCLQCHPSYSVAPVKDPTTGTPQVNTGPMYAWAANAQVDKSKIDCLICHADLVTSNYGKAKAPFGEPTVKDGPGCFPSCLAPQSCINGVCVVPSPDQKLAALTSGAKSIHRPDRANCGSCHFNAGGGDNVKMGDLGSALANPVCNSTTCVDVHMGTYKKTCADCHAAPNHKIKGAGLSIPIDTEGRLSCNDCHASHHHTIAKLDAHAAFIACQTCHIPKFSQTQYTKVNWDWSQAGDKGLCRGLAGCVPVDATGLGGEADKSNNHLTPAEAAAYGAAEAAKGYDWKKGVSTYAKNVTPVYRWFDGTGTHAATDNSAFTSEPAVLAKPNGAPGVNGSKIYPFKKMTGKSAGLQDGSKMLVPHVFKDDGFWATTLVLKPDGTCCKPTVPVFLADGVTRWTWTQAGIDAIWKDSFNYGAGVAGQLGTAAAKAAVGGMTRATDNVVTVTTTLASAPAVGARVFLVGAEATFPSGLKTVTSSSGTTFTYTETLGTTPASATPSTKPVTFFPEISAWKWVSTEMYVNLNHEVQPKAKALQCVDCHPGTGGTSRMQDLYSCSDPANCPLLPH